MKHNLWKRTVSLLMSVVMLMSLVVVPAQAEETGASAGTAEASVQASQQAAPAAVAGTVTGDFAAIVTECPAGVTVKVSGDETGCWKLVQNAGGKWFAKVTDENNDFPALNVTITMPESDRYALIFDYAIDGNSSVEVCDSEWSDAKYLEDDTTKVDIDSTAFKSEAIRLAAESDTRTFNFTGMHVSHAAYLTNLRIVKIEPAVFSVTLPEGAAAVYSVNDGEETSFTSNEAVEVMMYDEVTVKVTVPNGQCIQGFYRSGDTTRLAYEESYTFTVTGDPASNKYTVKTLPEEGIEVDGYTTPEGLTVKTYGTHIWTLQDGVLTSGNQRIKESDSTLAITAAKNGVLIFEYKVSSNAFTDGEGYGNVLYYKTDSKPTCHSYGRRGNLIPSDALNADEAANYSGETEWQQGSVSLKESQTVYFSFWNDEVYEFDGQDTAWIRNVFLSSGANVSVSVTADKADYGTVSGDKLNQAVPEGSRQTYTATPKDGGQFYGWFDDSGKLLSLENTYTCVAREGLALTAKFDKPASEYDAWNMDKGELGTLTAVVNAARSGDTVLLTKDATLSADLTIPTGVTLVVPCTAEDQGNGTKRSVNFKADGIDTTGAADIGEPPLGTNAATATGRRATVFRTLTINSDVTMTVNGTLVVNAEVGRPRTGHIDYDINGGCGQVENNGTIDIQSGGAVDAFGLIEGASGNVTVRSGGTLTDLYVVINWRGGSQAEVMSGANVYPMNEYKADNISSAITVHSGGAYSGFVRMCGKVFSKIPSYQSARFPQVDNSNGLIRLAENATLTKKVENGREKYIITGGATFGGSALSIMGLSLSTNSFIYPINGTYDFVLKNGDYAFTESFKFMPGATVITSKANLTVSEGKTVVFYGKFEDVQNTDSTQYPADRSAAKLTLSDDSSLTVDGTFAGTVESGRDAKNIKKGANAKFTVTTKEANGYKNGARELSFDFIPSTFAGYNGGWDDNVYTWTKDKYTITFNTDGGNSIEDMFVEWGEKLTLPTPTRAGYTFAGWYNGETKFTDTTMPKQSLTLTAKWTANTDTAYTVEHYQENLAGTGYTKVDTDKLAGTTGATTAAAAKSYPGFTAGTVTQTAIAADGSTVVRINYTRNSYTLTWNFAGGTDTATGYTTDTVKFGAAITKPSAAPTRTGYTFAKWDKYTDGMTMPANDLTITAQWTLNSYSITYHLDGGTVSGNPTSYTVTSDFTLNNPTREGYTFVGWSGTGISGMEKTVTIKNATGSRTYTANWKVNQYTITFDTDGGSEIAAITQDYGATITAPAAPTKTGYTFAGWDKDIPSTMPASNLTVKATWKINQYTVTFNTDGGSVIAAITQNYGTKITAPAAPARIGYTFAGWDKEIPATMPAEDVTVTAQWKINQYTVTFKNGDEVVQSTEMNYGSTITAPADPTKEGYTFKGWQGYTKDMTVPAHSVTFAAMWKINQYTLTFKNGETVYKTITQNYGTSITAPENPIRTGYTFEGWDAEIPATMPAESRTLTAQWTANRYTVTFDTNGGSKCDSVTVTYDQPYGTLPTPKKEGYTFTGWYDGDTLIYNTTTYRTDGNKTLTAHWGIVSYTITYIVNNEVLEDVTDTRAFGASLDKLYTYTKTGYTVSEWTQKNGINPPATMPARQVYLYATTTPISYTISYELNGGTNAAGNPTSYTVESGEITLAAPSREGYTFQGWRSGATPEMAPVIAAGSIGSKSYEAVWQVNSHTLKYVQDGVETTETVDYGETVTVKAAPTKTGYTFSGWKVEGAAPENGQFTMPDKDVTITGSYTANQYTVTFNANGGSECGDITVTYDRKYSALPETTRTGYTFNGWYDGSTQVTADTDVKITADQTLTAKWTANTYTVTFNADGGSACAAITVTYDGKYPTLPNPTREGYTFNGWFDGETRVTDGAAVTITKDQTLTAHWGINTYTITYQVDGQTVKTESVTYGADIPVYTYTKTGYDVSAWSPDVPQKMPAQNLTFAATSTVHQHRLTYVLDGVTTIQVPVNYGTSVAVQAAPTKTGYTFSGWTVEGAEHVDGKFTMPDNDVTITGSFTANTYTVKFAANDGEGSMGDQSFIYDAEQSLAANGFTRTGWRFTGWKMGNTAYTDGQTVNNLTAEANGVVTMEAQWEHILYTLKFVDKSGKVHHTEQKYYGDAITPPEAPEKEGYRFDGWDQAIPATMPAGDLTITAKWTSYLTLLIDMGDDFSGEKLDTARGYYQKMTDDQRGEYQSEEESLYNAFVTAVRNVSIAALEENVANAVTPTNGKLLIEDSQIAELTLNGRDVETRLIDENYPAVNLTSVDFLTVLFGYGEIISVQVGDQPEVSFADGTGGKQMELMLAVARQAGVELKDSAHTYISVLDGKSMPVKLNGKTAEGITYSVTYQLSFFNNTHKITWNANGGVGGTTTIGTYGEAIKAPVVTRVGYTFAGWEPAVPANMGKAALTFTAKWTANTDTAYTVKHHYETLTGGYDVVTVLMTGTTGTKTEAAAIDKTGFTTGTVTQDTIAPDGSTIVDIYYTRNSYKLTVDAANGTEATVTTYKFGTTITAPAAPTKTGYAFAGWDKTIPTTMPAENVTVKATWKVNKYTVTFDTDGGSAIDPITQDYGTDIAAPADPTKTGYTFAGWDKTIPAKMPAENVTVTAKWTINRYTVTFDTDGGSEIAAITQDYGTAITAPENPTKTGYSFAGWDKTIPAKMPAENVTVKATWKINQYTVTFDTDGGSKIDPITQDYGTDIAKPADPTKTGYTFAGWDKTIPATMPAKDVTVKATWKINQYTVTFDTDGGSAIDSITQNYGTAITAPVNPTKTGYTFAGWYTDADCTNAWNFGSDTLADHDMTLYARWVRDVVRKATITGSVELNNRPAVGAVVELMLGNRKISAATTDANGAYSFQTVETGTYSIVAAKDGKTRTVLVNIDRAGSYTVDMIVLPGTDVSTEVRIEMPATPPAAGSEPKADVSKTTVGGLDAVADKYAESNRKVALLLTIAPKTAEEIDAAVRTAIEERSSGQKVEFVDMTLSKTVDDAPAAVISDTGDRLLTISIPFATSGVSVGSMVVYRCIDGTVETLTSTPNADGEFIEVRGGTLVLHTGKPTTYAIGYRLRSGSSYGGTYSLTSGDGQNGKAGELLQFGVNSGSAKVSAVYVDGTQLGGSDYTVKGTLVRLKGVYTATLAQGYHFGTVYYDNGYIANFSFTLSGKTSPRTADMGIGLYAASALASLTGMAWVGKKRGSGCES